MAYSSFKYNVDDGMTNICLNDPESLNALTFETYTETDLAQALDAESREQARLMQAADCREGYLAFVEKRAAKFNHS